MYKEREPTEILKIARVIRTILQGLGELRDGKSPVPNGGQYTWPRGAETSSVWSLLKGPKDSQLPVIIIL